MPLPGPYLETGQLCTCLVSRAVDSAKGGDIDLYAQAEDKEDLLEKKIDFAVSLISALGDQKIDIIVARNPARPIEQEALKRGIKL